MRSGRVLGDSSGPSVYHVYSRLINREKRFGMREKEKMVELLVAHARMAGVELVTYAVMGNHFHALVEVPDKAQADCGVDDEEIMARLRCRYDAGEMVVVEAEYRRVAGVGNGSMLEGWRARQLARMHDLSVYVKEVKQRMTQWYNRRSGRSGPLWEDRFKSVLLEGRSGLVLTVAAYIDLNAVRAGLCEDPKDYRHCGYAAALVGRPDRVVGLGRLVESLGLVARRRRAEVLAVYRMVMFGALDRRRGGSRVSRGRIEAALAGGGALPRAVVAAQAARFLTVGLVLGTREFVEGFWARRSRPPGGRGGSREGVAEAAAGCWALGGVGVGAARP